MSRKILRVIVRPSTKHFIHLVESNLIANCPVTKDILAAEHIFGPDIGSLTGKTTRKMYM